MVTEEGRGDFQVLAEEKWFHAERFCAEVHHRLKTLRGAGAGSGGGSVDGHRARNQSANTGCLRKLWFGRACLSSGATSLTENPSNVSKADVIIYGGSCAAITAAVQLRRMGKSVIVVSPDKHLGGLSSGGLGFTDSGNTAAIGGLALEFYKRLYAHYRDEANWRWEKRGEYGNQGQETPALDHKREACWCFEPRAAEGVFEGFVAEYGIRVDRDEWLDRESGVVMEGGRIKAMTTLSGKSYAGSVFIDATYEGDLMAAAGVDYHVGREANAVYDEQWNGVQVGVLHHRHWFMSDVSPYKTEGDAKSGLLPHVSAADPGRFGEGDKKVQAYCFRVCMSRHPENRRPFPKPAGYDAAEYELFLRAWAKRDDFFWKFDKVPNLKTDTNNHGAFSQDYIGMNWDYPEATYQRRKEIVDDHARYQKGLLYFAQNDPRVPAYIHEGLKEWGLPLDEYTDNDNWSPQLYVREARRMIGMAVMTEHEVLNKRGVARPVGMGSYALDSHNVQRYVKADGFVQNEGDIGVHGGKPYGIDMGCLVARKGQAANLVVPICMSASHTAYGSIRMEPVFMVLGQSAATMASMAIDAGLDVQDVEYAALKARLVKDGQVLTLG
jgi:hypothetical protein